MVKSTIMTTTQTNYKFNGFSISLYQESLDKLLAAGKPETDWEVKHNRKHLAEHIKKDHDIANGTLQVLFKNKQTGKYTIKIPDCLDDYEWYEKWQLKKQAKKCYDVKQNALCGDRIKKASIFYSYMPAELMEENVPFILGWEMTYDGGAEQKIAIQSGEAICMRYNDLKNVFTLNTFE